MYLHTLLVLLPPLASTIGIPDCVRPPPPRASIPTVADCDQVLQLITITARFQRNMPLTWSRHPPAKAGQKLPAYFSSDASNGCEFVVDVEGGSKADKVKDVFPLGDVVFIGRDIVLTCLVGEAQAEDTVGSLAVGPRQVVRVTLRKKGVAAGGSLQLLNGTLMDFNMSGTA